MSKQARPQWIHAHTLSGLLHVEHQAAALDDETITKFVLYLTQDQRQAVARYRMMVFNVLSHNQDDHAKPFSFLMEHDGTWTTLIWLAPA